MDYSQFKLKNVYDKRNKGKNSSYSPKNIQRNTASENNEAYFYYTQTKHQENTTTQDEQYKNQPVREAEAGPVRMQTEHYVERIINEEAPKKKRDRMGIIVVVLIIFCFVFVVLATEIITGGLLINELKQAVNKNYDTSYYLVGFDTAKTKYEAESLALSCKENGGAGFVYIHESTYFVAIATYLDKKSAEAVVKKNSGTSLIEVVLNKYNYDNISESEREEFKKVIENSKLWVEEIYSISTAFTNENSSVSCYDKLTVLRNKVLSFKEEILNGGLSKPTKDKALKIIAVTYENLEGIIIKNSEDGLSSDIRYALCDMVYNLVSLEI